MISEATVITAHGISYMNRVCRNFAHKVPTMIADSQGRIEFPFAACRIEVDDEHMYEVDDPANIGRAENVIAEHLVRMANKGEPVVQWKRSDDTQNSKMTTLKEEK